MAYPIRWDEIAAPVENEAPVFDKPEQAASLRGYFYRLTATTVAGVILVCLIVMALSAHLLRNQQGPALQLDSISGSGVLAVGTPVVVRKLGFVTVTGTLVNRTAISQTGVEVVVDLLDTQRNTLSSQSALVDRDKIGPGERSSFRIEMVDAPAAAAYRLRFTSLH